ncbi:hypothetical protein SCHPADRAFT_939614 [Schizopora paradoxa]|uniref:Uncharacterized protein n=1 Tax=Schizopora paradoxa TaxID=27342 RepID=A0A0H2RQR0_9AGAM|nr:hypothetical protein SCHPADRAFT_939614 [Schizopora paradoxa]
MPQDSSSSDGLSDDSSSILNALRRDDITFSYYSTISTNQTMSDLEGPGRILGNLYSRAGLLLERGLGRLAVRAGIGSYAKTRDAVSKGFFRLFESDDTKEHEETCDVLLLCARSEDVKIQIEVFQCIIDYSIIYPSKVRSAFKGVFKRRQENGDLVAFSWKRHGVEYNFKWLFMYKLVCRCLTSDPNSAIEAAPQFGADEFESWDFSLFEELLRNCSDVADLLLANRIIHVYWNRDEKGIAAYVRRKGPDDPALGKFAAGLVVHWEFCFSQPSRDVKETYVWEPLRITKPFLDGMWKSLRDMEIKLLAELLEDDTRLAVWVDVFKVRHLLRSIKEDSWKTWADIKRFYIEKTWKDLCYENLPNPDQSSLRRKLLCLEDIHGPQMRERFPPQEGSWIDFNDQFIRI